MDIFTKVVLSLSGLALFYACYLRLIQPDKAVFLQSYFEHPGNSLKVHIDLANEIRGVGAVMLLGGIVILIGTVRADFRLAALVVATVIFGGVVLGRSLSSFIDGPPSGPLMRAAVAEGVLAALNILCLIRVLMQGQES